MIAKSGSMNLGFSFCFAVTFWYFMQITMHYLSPDQSEIVHLNVATAILATVLIWFLFRGLNTFWSEIPDHPSNIHDKPIKRRFLEAYPLMPEGFANYLQTVYYRCVYEYNIIVSANPNIDAGHSVNHVKKVEELTFQALKQYYEMKSRSDPTLKTYADTYYGGSESCLEIPMNAVLRVMIGSLLHEVGDQKFADKTIKKPKAEIIGKVVTKVLHDYHKYSEELKTDIINMIDYCGAATWGDRIPPGSHLYELIIRWADRTEATGYIGIVRTMTFSYSKRQTYPLCRDEDEFPTTLDELEHVAPNSRWLSYSNGKKPSESGFSHYLDKIVHISGQDVPLPYLKEMLNEGQNIVKQFVIDFTTKNNKQFDIDWILSHLDPEMYNVEIDQIKEMQQVMKAEGCKWIK